VAIEEGPFGIRRHQVLKAERRNIKKAVAGAIAEFQVEKESFRSISGCGEDRGFHSKAVHGATLFMAISKTFGMDYVFGMTSPGYPTNILSLYQRVVSAGVREYLQKQAGAKVRRGVYSAQVVLGLMIRQRLHAVGTLAVAVQLLIQGAAGPLLANCQGVRKQRISSRTGGYGQARGKWPTILFRQVVRERSEQLRTLWGLEGDGAPRVYVVDGSSVELEPSRELIKSYPPAENQPGVSHWPVLKMVVMHELQSGLAEEPSRGPL
jgi:hypothetical protein